MPPAPGRNTPRFRIALIICLWLASLEAGQIPSPVRPPFQIGPPPADLDLVLAYVTVTASKNESAPRLASGDFRIEEDGTPQKIDYFAVQDRPLSVGILWGGGTGFEDPAPDPDIRECPRTFMKNTPMGSEYFLLTADTVLKSYTTNQSLLPLNYALSGASSDHVFIGLDVLKESANPRKVLLVIAKPGGGGGGQLQSDYVERAAIKLGTTQVYVVSFITDAAQMKHEASIFYNELVDLTGGSYYLGPVSNVECANLAKSLRVQYLIGYHPTNKAKDGKWRKLSAKIESSGGSKLKARIKRGYYAAKDSPLVVRAR